MPITEEERKYYWFTAQVCPYCDSYTKLVDSIEIYKYASYGNAYVCNRYPECDAYVGCHRGTEIPLGRLANSRLRKWKMRAHAAFDSYWRKRNMKRGSAYAWMAQVMNLPREEAHIGMFTVAQCQELVNTCKEQESQDLFEELEALRALN